MEKLPVIAIGNYGKAEKEHRNHIMWIDDIVDWINKHEKDHKLLEETVDESFNNIEDLEKAVEKQDEQRIEKDVEECKTCSFVEGLNCLKGDDCKGYDLWELRNVDKDKNAELEKAVELLESVRDRVLLDIGIAKDSNLIEEIKGFLSEEIDKQDAKSAPNDEISEILPGKAKLKHIAGLCGISYKLFEYMNLPKVQRSEMELNIIYGKVLKAINFIIG